MSKFLLILFSIVVAATTGRSQADNPADFTVSAPLEGSKFTLSEHRGKTVVLHFLLKTECPYCLKYTREYALLSETTRDTVHVFLKPDSDKEIKSWVSHLDKKNLQKLPKIYRDTNAELAEQFGIPDGYHFHGEKVHYPALVAIDGSGKEMFRYIGKSNSDRLGVKDFLAKLQLSK